MLRALRDDVIVVPDAVPTETPAGLVIPDIVLKDNPNYFTTSGRVVAVGPRQDDVAVGDRIHFRRFSGKYVMHEGQKHLILIAEEVVGKVPPEALVAQVYEAPKMGRITNGATV